MRPSPGAARRPTSARSIAMSEATAAADRVGARVGSMMSISRCRTCWRRPSMPCRSRSRSTASAADLPAHRRGGCGARGARRRVPGWVNRRGCRIGAGCTVSGGRHRRVPEAGLTSHELMGQIGHRSLADASGTLKAATRGSSPTAARPSSPGDGEGAEADHRSKHDATYTNIATHLHKHGSK